MSDSGDSYLELAERVLRAARKPLSSRQIIDLAFMYGMVPKHLYGATQYKTVGARLSEDILHYKKASKFFRNRPGRFFLREFIRDKSLPLEYRTPIVASRRRRSLKTKNVLCLPAEIVELGLGTRGVSNDPDWLKRVLHSEAFDYSDLKDIGAGRIPIFSYVIIFRDNEVLWHTKGSYAEQRRAFTNKTMLGFPVPGCREDLTLLDRDDHGRVQAGLTAVANDLDLEFSVDFPRFEINAELTGFCRVSLSTEVDAVVGIVKVDSHSDFEPLGKRLAVGSLDWAPVPARSSRGAFDPWTNALLRNADEFAIRRLL